MKRLTVLILLVVCVALLSTAVLAQAAHAFPINGGSDGWNWGWGSMIEAVWDYLGVLR